MLCPKCNAEIPDDAKFCTKCGASLQEASQTPQSPPPPPPAAETTASVEYAGFWKRAAAYVIDIVFLQITWYILTMLLSFILVVSIKITANFTGFWSRPAGDFSVIGIIGPAIGFSVVWLYFAVQESSSGQATLGKNIMKIYVTDFNKNRISFALASGRFWSKQIPIIIPGLILSLFLAGLPTRIAQCAVYIIWFGLAGFTLKKQAGHDFIAKTLVLKR